MSTYKHLRASKLDTAIARYLDDLRLRNYSERTLTGQISILGFLDRYCAERGITHVSELNEDAINGFRRHLYHYRNRLSGKTLAFATQASRLVAVRSFCRWLTKHGVIDSDPSVNLEIPKLPRRKLVDVLSKDELFELLNVPDVSSPYGVRDRAILETFFSTAIRASELGSLQLSDIDSERRLVRVIDGKGSKDRVAPIGTSALEWIDKYLTDVRPLMVNELSGHTLFIGQRGKPLSRVVLALVVRTAMRQIGLHKRGACHLFRHTAATMMLENGADLRSLQQYLGHERLDTTQLYTHQSLDRLQEIHDITHPTGDRAARPESQPGGEGETKPNSDGCPETEGDSDPQPDGTPPTE